MIDPTYIRKMAVCLPFAEAGHGLEVTQKVLIACADVYEQAKRDHFPGAHPPHGICRCCMAIARLEAIAP